MPDEAEIYTVEKNWETNTYATVRCITDRRAAVRVGIGHRHATRPRLVAFLQVNPLFLVSLDLNAQALAVQFKMRSISCESASEESYLEIVLSRENFEHAS